MAINPSDAIDVPLSLFGGRITELAPSDVPEGGSPANEDVAFVPGSVFQRPGLHKAYSSALPNNATVVYEKTYVQPNGDPITLLLDSNGILWKEDVANNPGVRAQLFRTQAGNWATSQTAFGREYLAISDLEHGADIPLQFNGVNLDRVTQDGPGSNPCNVQDYSNQVDIGSISDRSGPQTIIAATELGSTATIQTAGAHGLKKDDYVLISGCNVTGYNGTWKITAVPSPTTFDFTTTTGLTAGNTGTVYPLTAVVTTDAAHGLIVGDIVVISGNTNTAYNNNLSATTPSYWTVTAVPTATTFEFQRISGTGTGGGGGSSAFVFVSGKSMPWSPISNPAYNYGLNDGTAATAVALVLSAGNIITITASGTITPSDSRPPAPPAGSPPATGSTGGSTGHHFPTLYMPGSTLGLAGLCGAFVNSSGLVVQPVSIGASKTLITPVGAVALQLGVNDDHFSDNIGSFQANVTLASAGGTGGTGGTVDIGGLSAAGDHQLVVVFETRQGFQTMPSPPLKFASAGLKKIQVSNIPIGPPNVKKRILCFTGAGGGSFFYIPVPAFISGIIVSTSTVIENNTDTSAVVDFADNTLFTGLAIDIPGNNLFQMRTLGPCSSFFNYAARLMAFGERNKVENFSNMGFDGGYSPLAPTLPLGWSAELPLSGNALELRGDGLGWMWNIPGTGTGGRDGTINQRADVDQYGDPILSGWTLYRVRVYGRVSAAGLGGNLTVALYGPSVAETEPIAFVQFLLSDFTTTGNYLEGVFSVPTPAQLATGTLLKVYTLFQPLGQNISIDDLEIIPDLTPYRDNIASCSYFQAPEQFDGLTGILGPATDPTTLQKFDVLRDTLLMYTKSGMHTTNDSAAAEPSNWVVNEFSTEIGLLSIRGEDHGDEEFHFLATRSGPRIFDGSGPYKIGQEIQPDWETINWAAAKTIWVKNDKANRRAYFGIPTGTTQTPNKILSLDYRGLDTAGQISAADPLVISSAKARKWTIWNILANCCDTIARPNQVNRLELGAGNGQALGAASGFGQTYYLDVAKLTDDDYGEIFPYYTTYFFVGSGAEIQAGLGSHRKLFVYLSMFVSGVGRIQVTPLVASLLNDWPKTRAYSLVTAPRHDLEFGLNVTGERVAFKIQPLPMPGATDKFFNLTKMVATMKPEPVAFVRGTV